MQHPHPGLWEWEALLVWLPSELVAKVENSLCIFALPHFGQTGFCSPMMSSSERSLQDSQVYS